MTTLNPSYLTPQWAIRSLEAGKSVPLEAPGWGDTQSHRCPDCDRVVKFLTAHPEVQFEYGVEAAHPHRCGQPPALADHPRWLQLEAVNRELALINEQRDWPAIRDYLEGR